MLSMIAYVAGGLVLFLYGMRLTTDGLREAAGGRLKAALSVLTSRRTTGILAGVTVTFFLSSSSAVSAMLVELANAGLLSLTQAIVVILGSTIGTALFLQVIAFDVSSWAFLILIAGFVAQQAFRYRRGKALGAALIGLALVFLGLDFMSRGVGERAADMVQSVTAWLDYRLLGFAVGIVLSVLVRSTATVGVAMVLAGPATGAGVPLENLVAVVLGAAVGTSSTTLIASLSGSRKGKQVFVAELTIRLAIAAIFLPLVGPTAEFILWATAHIVPGAGSSSLARRAVANVHLFTSLCAVLLVLPFVSLLAAFAKRVVGKSDRIPSDALQYIAFEKDLPAEEALTRAHAELLRMGDMACGLVGRAARALRDNNDHELERIEQADKRIDLIDEVLSEYLGRLKADGLDAEALEVRAKLLYITKDIENIADMATREMTHIGWQKSRDNIAFTDVETGHFDEMVALVQRDFAAALKTVRGGDPTETLRAGALEHAHDLDRQREQVFEEELTRIAEGKPSADESAAHYMNAVNALRIVHFLITDIIRVVSSSPLPPRGAASPRPPIDHWEDVP